LAEGEFLRPIRDCENNLAIFQSSNLPIPYPTRTGDPQPRSLCHARSMTTESLTQFSESLADAVSTAAPSVVQVHGAGQPASGLVFAPDTVITTMRALGREDGLHVRGHDGPAIEAQLAGWDPTTSLALLRVTGLGGAPIAPATKQPRVGHLTLAVGRSWSNALSASAGIVSVIGGPLRTGRRRAIDQVLRTTAPMHGGFAGGALVDTAGALLGVITSTRIRGTTVVIPASIAWKAASNVLEHGSLKRGYLGIAGQPVRLPADLSRPAGLPAEALAEVGSPTGATAQVGLLIVAVTPQSPAAAGGLLVGDIILSLDGNATEAPEDLFDLLWGNRVGTEVRLDIMRGGVAKQVPITVGERPKE
jgi:S1-C subfamily serine protease